MRSFGLREGHVVFLCCLLVTGFGRMASAADPATRRDQAGRLPKLHGPIGIHCPSADSLPYRRCRLPNALVRASQRLTLSGVSSEPALSAPAMGVCYGAPLWSAGRHMSFIGKLWRGEYGLAGTFWLWGLVYVLLIALAMLLVFSYALRAAYDPSFGTAAFVVLAMLVVVWGYSIVWAVGLWRAAFAYNGPRLWSVLACLVSVLIIVSLVAQCAGVV